MNDDQLNLIDFDAQISTKDLSRESASFLWLALLKDVLIELPHYEHSITNDHDEASAKQEMIKQLRLFHVDNPVQLKKVDEFEEFYDCKEMAVYLYSKDASIHQPINVALRTKDIDALIKYRYFISHLCSDLADRCTKYRHDHPHAPPYHVYRGQILSTREIDRLRNNLHKLVAMNGFCATSRDREMAVKFAKNVIFDIEVDPEKHPALVFADIAHVSQFEEEKEILFDLSTVFRIEKIIDESDSLTCIHLSASSEGRELVDKYLARQRAEMPEFSLNFPEALHYYDQARSLLQQANPPRRQELATTLDNMASVFSQCGNHEQALKYLHESLSILKEFRSAGHIDIAGAYNNIGIVFRELGELERSLENHRLALAMYKKVGLPTVHPDVADCIHNLAVVHHNMEEFDVALSLYQEALAIRRQCQLSTHPDIATNINDIGYLLCDAGRIDDGFEYFEQAYALRIANEDTSRIDLADSFNNMGVVNRHRGNFPSDIDFYTRALTIYEAVLPADHEIITKTRNNLELVQGLELSMKIES